MINYNKLYSGFFSVILISTIMAIFEIIFFAYIVCPVITTNIYKLMESYKSKNEIKFEIDPDPVMIIQILNLREYQLINNFNQNNYLIIVIFIIFLISLLLYLYNKINIIEISSNVSSESNLEMSHLEESVNSEQSVQHLSLGTNVTNNSSKYIYLKNAIWCAFFTILCLIVYQIFFYNYGLEFKYIGSENEIIYLFIESIKS